MFQATVAQCIVGDLTPLAYVAASAAPYSLETPKSADAFAGPPHAVRRHVGRRRQPRCRYMSLKATVSIRVGSKALMAAQSWQNGRIFRILQSRRAFDLRLLPQRLHRPCHVLNLRRTAAWPDFTNIHDFWRLLDEGLAFITARPSGVSRHLAPIRN